MDRNPQYKRPRSCTDAVASRKEITQKPITLEHVTTLLERCLALLELLVDTYSLEEPEEDLTNSDSAGR